MEADPDVVEAYSGAIARVQWQPRIDFLSV